MNCEIDIIKYKGKKEIITLSKFILDLLGVCSGSSIFTYDFSTRKFPVFIHIEAKFSGQGRARSASRKCNVITATGLC